jgi:predicted transcriptional regulator
MGKTIGDRELALLEYLAGRPGSTAAQVAEEWGAPRELARSTALTMLERLRRKGHLTRRIVQGTYRYHLRAAADDVVRGVVRSFVERTLRGSVSPVVAYLAEEAEVSEADAAELEELLARLHARKRDEEPR